MKSPLTCLLFVACLLGTGLAVAQDGKLLPPTYLVGKTYVLHSTYHGETELGPMPGQPNAQGNNKQVIDMEFHMTASCTENAKEAGTLAVKSTIDAILMKMKMGNMVMDYDSKMKGSEETLLGKSFHTMIGKDITYIVGKDGKILRVEGLDQLPVGQGGMNPLGEEQLKQMAMPGMTLGIPAEGIAPGATWNQENEIAVGQIGKFSLKQNLVYEKDEKVEGHDCAVLKNEGTLAISPAAKPRPGGFNITAKDGKMSGVLLIDKALRFPREVTSNMTMTVVMPNPMNQAEKLEAPVENRVTLKLVKVSDS